MDRDKKIDWCAIWIIIKSCTLIIYGVQQILSLWKTLKI